MRSSVAAFLVAMLTLAASQASASDLTLTLNSAIGFGVPTNLPPDADSCLQPNCVLFTGTLTDADTDDSFIFLNSISVSAFAPTPASGLLTIDNTFYDDVPGILSGDPNYAADGNPSNTYTGPIFGIDIAPRTAPGVYDAVVTLFAAGGTGDPNDNGFQIEESIQVDVVAPEPASAALFFAGLLPFAIWRGAKHKWRSSEVSR